MLEKEKAYLKGEFTPFEESTQSDGTDIKKRSKSHAYIHNMHVGMKKGGTSICESKNETENANDEAESEFNLERNKFSCIGYP